MKPLKQPFLFVAAITAVLFFDGCGTQNKFASSFGKRRYNKGFYWDVPGNIKPVAAIANEPAPYKNIIGKTISPPSVTINGNNESLITPNKTKSAIIKRPKNKIAQFVMNAIPPKYVRDLLPSLSSINSHHEKLGDTHTKNLGLVLIGAFIILIPILLIVTSYSPVGYLSAGLVIGAVLLLPALILGILLIGLGLGG